MKCSLCGYEFKEEEAGCEGCPLSFGCNLIKCPNCSYEFPKDSKIIKWLKSKWAKWKK